MNTDKHEVAVPMEEVAANSFDDFDTKTKANEGIELKLRRADGEDSGLRIRVLGSDSESFTTLKEKHDRKRIKTMRRLGPAATDILLDAGQNDSMDLTVACCLSWRHENGKPMPFELGTNVDMTKKLFKDYPLIYDQVQAGIFDRTNFTKASAKL